MISNNLKTLRTTKGLSQEELAVRLNVVRQTISKWEKGLSVPDSEMLIKIADTFEVSVSDLLGENIEPTDSKSELQLIANKLEQLNTMFAAKSARNRKIMKGIAYCLFAAVSIYVLSLVISIIQFVSIPINPNSGIVGGVDGPKEVFVTMNIDWFSMSILLICCIAVLIVAFVLLHKGKRN